MPTKKLEIEKLITERVLLIPYTIEICTTILKEDYSALNLLNLKKGKGWPDKDVLETLPKIITNLSKVTAPTGFESWMIIKKDTMEIIGDLGFKGFNSSLGTIDLGYGIIASERRKGYAEEAVKALLQWAFSNEIVKEITANCLQENTPSIHLLKKCNFTQTKIENEMLYWTLLKNN